MEGRAIARPNTCASPICCATQSLQWRAGQLPGQTNPGQARPGHYTCPLQWRAGQLPGQTLCQFVLV